jgi:hypothetical protein
MNRMHLLKLSSAAVARDPVLSSRTKWWWERERAEGEAVRKDIGVQRAANREGLGYEQGGELATRAEGFIRELVKGYDQAHVGRPGQA